MHDAKVRAAVRADFTQILALYRDLSPEDPVLDPKHAMTIWEQMLASPSTSVLVAEIGDFLAASCTITIVPNLTRGGRPYALVENVVTRRSHRRQGFGTAVLHEAQYRAWAAGCYKVLLATGSTRPGTLQFYEAAGFVRGTKTAFEIRRA